MFQIQAREGETMGKTMHNTTESVDASGADLQPGQWVTFWLADETYGINVMQVQEVLRMTDVAPVPGAPYFVLGIINLRGNVVTVIDLRTRLNLPCSELTEQSRILIVETHEMALGLLVDSIAEVVNLQNDEIDSSPTAGNEEGGRYIQGIYSTDERLIILIEIDKLIDAEMLGEGGQA